MPATAAASQEHKWDWFWRHDSQNNDKNMTLSIMTLEVPSVIYAECCVFNVMLSVIATLLPFVIMLPKVAARLSA